MRSVKFIRLFYKEETLRHCDDDKSTNQQNICRSMNTHTQITNISRKIEVNTRNQKEYCFFFNAFSDMYNLFNFLMNPHKSWVHFQQLINVNMLSISNLFCYTDWHTLIVFELHWIWNWSNSPRSLCIVIFVVSTDFLQTHISKIEQIIWHKFLNKEYIIPYFSTQQQNNGDEWLTHHSQHSSKAQSHCCQV